MSAWRKFFGRHTDIALVLLVLGVLVVLFAPIPSSLLDFLILANFSFAFLLLLLTFYMAKPVEFSTFPSLLLVATLFRLSLNVAATRLILSEGDAGRVIGAVGSYVVGGNYVIGFIVFLILIVVQYVVVTNGAQRVSEVAARFTLDSMPGQQMSIDADLNMGFIDQVEAQRRRKLLEKESAFYGAMDGASKFVKGDAIAGILIMLINIIGGLVIGVMQLGLPWDQAIHTYTLLTIGDGIVTQVPALVIAVGTGIIVTRSASDANLSKEVLRQILSFPKTLLLVAAALGGLLLLPGIPALPTVSLLVFVLLVAWAAHRAQQRASQDDAFVAEPNESGAGEGNPQEDPYALLSVEPIEVLLGTAWLPRIGPDGLGLKERMSSFRKQMALDMGLVLPVARFKEHPRLAENRYEIAIDGTVVARGEVKAGCLLAIHPNGDQRAVPGEPTRDPTYGLPALWIDESQRERAQAARFTLVDLPTVLTTHLTDVLKREAAALLTRAETEKLLDRLRKQQAGLVEELVPTVLSVTDIQRVLQALLREKVSIRHLEAILETLADAGRSTKDVAVLTERVRQRLGQSICQSLTPDGQSLQVMTLDAGLESELMHGLRRQEQEGLPLDPRVTEALLASLVQHCDKMMKSNLLPVLLCSPDLRRHMRLLSERLMPHLRILSMTEVPQTVSLRAYAVVNIASNNH